jgi:hypothetical protein
MNTFEAFYFGLHTGRKLTWQPSLGTADIKATFRKRKYVLVAPTHHVIVLLLFNSVEAKSGLGLTHMQAHTGLPDAELRRILQALACGKVRILTKVPMSRTVEDGDIFHVNDAFSSKMVRVKIQQLASKDNTAEREVCCPGERGVTLAVAHTLAPRDLRKAPCSSSSRIPESPDLLVPPTLFRFSRTPKASLKRSASTKWRHALCGS